MTANLRWIDEVNKDEVARLEKLNVSIKEKHIPISNLNLYKFTVGSHTAAARHHLTVRPETGAPKPEATDSKYCVYDAAHKGYLYTEAWVNKLSKDLADAQAFQRVIGSTPVAQ